MYLDPFDSTHSGRIDEWDDRAAILRIILGWLLVGCGVYFFKQLAPALACKRQYDTVDFLFMQINSN